MCDQWILSRARPKVHIFEILRFEHSLMKISGLQYFFETNLNFASKTIYGYKTLSRARPRVQMFEDLRFEYSLMEISGL